MKKKKGKEHFINYYQTLFMDSWPGLFEAMMRPVQLVARTNKFADVSLIRKIFNDKEKFLNLDNCFIGHLPTPIIDKKGLMTHYLLDGASLFPAMFLDIQPFDLVGDLCAGPGGKALIIVEQLGPTGRLIANDMSKIRKNRLLKTFQTYLPDKILEEKVKVVSFDASKWCLYETAVFDKVLLDVPCSSERHVLKKPQELEKWSIARIKNLSIRQYAILASAFLLLKKGGRIVYSTCALSCEENDSVVAKLIKKKREAVKIIPVELSIGRATDLGWQILPDQTGYGPIYFSVIEKNSL